MDFREKGNKSNVVAGFTLIETLVAMMILSVSLTVILQLFSGGLKAGGASGEHTRAVFHAKEKMEETLVAGNFSESDTSGEFEDGFKWNAVVSYVPPDSDEKNKSTKDLYSLDIIVSWNDGIQERSFTLSTLALQ